MLAHDALPDLLPPRGYVAPEEVRAADGRSGAVRDSVATHVLRAIAEATDGGHAAALAMLEEASALARGDAASDVLVLLNRAQLLLETGDLARAADEAAAALRVARREKRERWVALASLGAALVHIARGRRAAARSRLGEAVRLFARTGDALRQVQCHYLLGEIAYLGDDPIRAGAHYRDALALARPAGKQEWVELLTLRFEHR
jgi:tetratricopeptide (TPR) repeat protein